MLRSVCVVIPKYSSSIQNILSPAISYFGNMKSRSLGVRFTPLSPSIQACNQHIPLLISMQRRWFVSIVPDTALYIQHLFCKVCNRVGGNRFGRTCEYKCSIDNPRATSCHGNLFCLPDPYGCSCDVGVKGIACDVGKDLMIFLCICSMEMCRGKIEASVVYI